MVLIAMSLQPLKEVTPAELEEELELAASWLRGNPSMRLELRSYASGPQARELSARRARAIRGLIAAYGIPDTRINIRALGDIIPHADRVDLVPIH